jgi:uncharacterized membrane protein
LPPQTQAEIAGDYEAHFNDGVAAGRSEDDVAARWGDPDRLARELRAEAALKRWETHRSPSGAAGAVFALLGLGALDILIMAPVLIGVASTLFGFAIADLGIFVVGAIIFAAGPFGGFGAGPAVAILLGVGVMTGAVALGAVLGIVAMGFFNAVVWYGRLHYQVLKPALEPQPSGAAL